MEQGRGYILNAFAASMLPHGTYRVTFTDITLEEARERAWDTRISAVGHADTAAVFASELLVDVPWNRVSVDLRANDWALLGQYQGPRLPEGATSLPEGARIRWMLLRVE